MRVLVVEHDVRRADARVAQLERLDYSVEVVEDGRTALRRWMATRPDFVLLGSDSEDMTALDVAESIRARANPHEPFIVRVVYGAEPLDVTEMLACGVDDVIEHTIEDDPLAARLAFAAARLTRGAETQAATGTLKDLLDSSRELILTVAQSGRILFANRAWTAATGHMPEGLTGQSVFEFLASESEPVFRRALVRALRTRTSTPIEPVFLTRRGVRVHVEGILRPRMHAGMPASVRCQFIDVSKRKRAEAGLRATLDAMGDRTGEDYLRVLVRHLAEALGVSQGIVLEAIDTGQDRFDCVARASQGAYREGGEVRLGAIPATPTVAHGQGAEPIPSSCYDALKWCFEAQDLLGVVLRTAHGAPLGVLAVLHDQRTEWDDEARELLAVFAQRAAAELGRLRAERELRRRERHATVIADLQRSLLAWHGAWERLQHVLAKVAVAAGAERLGLFRASELHGKDTEITLAVDWVRPDSRIEQPHGPPRHLRLHRTFGAVSQTLRRGEIVRISLGSHGRGIDRVLQRARLPAAVLAPIMDGEEIAGLMVVGYARASAIEGPAVWDLLASTANALSLAVQHHRAQTHLNSVVDSIEEIVWSIAASDRRRLYVNSAVERVFARPVDDFYEGEDVWGQAIVPADAEMVEAFFHELCEGGAGEIEYRIMRPDGSIRWLRDRASVHRDAHGRAVRIDGVASDITKMRESWQRTLVLSSLGEKLNRASNPRDAVLIILEAADELLGWDAAWLDMGSPRDASTQRPVVYTETIGRERVEITPASTSALHRDVATQLALRQRGKVIAATALETQEPWVSLQANAHSAIFVPIRSGGDQIGVLAVRSHEGRSYGRDDLWTLQSLADYVGGALHRVGAETRWRDAELQAQAMVDALPDPVFRVDRSGICLAALGPSDQTLRRAGDLIPRHHLATRLPPAVAETWLSTVRTVLDVRDSRTFEYALPAGDDVVYFEASVAPAGIEDVLVVVRDITTRVQAESDRRHMERAMQESQKLESLGVLAGGIAHDFNNLLTSIMGYASLARMKLPEGDPASGHLVEVERATESAAELAMLMLAYSGRGQFVIEPFALEDVVRSIEGLLYAQLMKLRSVLSWELASDLTAVEGDVAQIRQVVLNLVLNAAQAMAPDGGVVRVAARMVMVGDVGWPGAYVGEDVPPGRYVCFDVTDTGRGMDTETLARIFDPFFTTKTTGRGLGLSAVAGIVRGHGGALHVQSHLGRGTTFTILLPACRATPSLRAPVVETTFERSGATVLVVDDEAGIRALARDALMQGGYTVHTAEGGEEALAIFDGGGETIDLVLLDMTMPTMSGVDVLQALRARGSDVLVLLSSGYSEADSISGLGGARPDGFLQKPYRAADLLGRLDSMLAARVNRARTTRIRGREGAV